jgi:galactitol-specific phosphotransferase system IIC component
MKNKIQEKSEVNENAVSQIQNFYTNPLVFFQFSKKLHCDMFNNWHIHCIPLYLYIYTVTNLKL